MANRNVSSADKPQAVAELEATLAERGATYGNFTDNAIIAQQIKAILRGGKSWGVLLPVQREALDVIASKVSRIVTGDPTYKDSWHDIQGYARIVEERM